MMILEKKLMDKDKWPTNYPKVIAPRKAKEDHDRFLYKTPDNLSHSILGIAA
jgi:hypothetical protein